MPILNPLSAVKLQTYSPCHAKCITPAALLPLDAVFPALICFLWTFRSFDFLLNSLSLPLNKKTDKQVSMSVFPTKPLICLNEVPSIYLFPSLVLSCPVCSYHLSLNPALLSKDSWILPSKSLPILLTI